MTFNYFAVLRVCCSIWRHYVYIYKFVQHSPKGTKSADHPILCPSQNQTWHLEKLEKYPFWKLGVGCWLYLRYNLQRILKSSCNQHSERPLKNTRSVSFRGYGYGILGGGLCFSSFCSKTHGFPYNLPCRSGHNGFFFRWDALVCNLASFWRIKQQRLKYHVMSCHINWIWFGYFQK